MLESREYLDGETSVTGPFLSPLRYSPNDTYYRTPQGGLQQWTFGRRNIGTGLRGANIEAAWDFLIDQEGRWANPPFNSRTPNLNPNLFGFGRDVGPTPGSTLNRTTPVIAIVDNGVQIPVSAGNDFPPHPDLNVIAPNEGWLAGESGDCTYHIQPYWWPDGGPGPPPPPVGIGVREYLNNAHGTAVAGIIVANRDNSEGISGVAPDSFWGSHRIIPNIDVTDPVNSGRTTDIEEAVCLTSKTGSPQGQTLGSVDIFVNAWGPVDGIDWRTANSVPGPNARAAILSEINGGRPDPHVVPPVPLGGIYVWAAGNGRQFNDNVNFDRYANNRFVIAVAAIDDAGSQTSYSEEGASVFISAPSSRDFQVPGNSPPEIVTTDIHIPDFTDPVCAAFFPNQADAGGYNYNRTARDPRNDFAECNEFQPDLDPFPNLAYTNYGHWSAQDEQGGFGGTSAAAPMVAGIIALMLDARDDALRCRAAPPGGNVQNCAVAPPTGSGLTAMPFPANNPLNLSWRDVQYILARSAYRTGSNTGWQRNDGVYKLSPDNDPGSTSSQGAHVSHKYGFGAIDALTAVYLAYHWPGVSPQYYFTTGTLDVPRNPADPPGTIGRTIPDNTGQAVGQIFTMQPGQTWVRCTTQQWEGCTGVNTMFPNNTPPLEWVEVKLTTEHQFAGDLEITLIGPNGTRSELAKTHLSGEPYTDWVFTTKNHWGESPLGNWTLQIKDNKNGDVGSWLNWELRFYTGLDFTVPNAAPPTANPDTATMVPSNTFRIVDVPANDVNGIRSTVTIVTPPNQMGTATVDGSGRIRYRSRPGFTGTETLQYVIYNQYGFPSAPATVTFQVVPVVNPPDPPIAQDDSFTTFANTPVTMNVLANDSDPDPGEAPVPATLTIVTPPPASAGTAVRNLPAGTTTFTPTAGFIGITTLTYRVDDPTGLTSNLATVTINVLASNIILPDAIDDTAATLLDTPVIITVLTNDRGVEAPLDPTGVQIVSPPDPARGTATVDPVTGQITFTPAIGVYGATTFTYRVRDTRGFFADPATVTAYVRVTPTAVNDAGVAFTTIEGASITVDPIANDSDLDGSINRTSLTILTPPTHGTLSVNPTTGNVTYSPLCEYSGEDTFIYTVRDNDGLVSNPATVKIVIVPVEDRPTANDDVAGTPMNTPVVLDLLTDILANDVVGDPGDMLIPSTFAIPIGGQPQNGTASVNLATGKVTYTPNPGFVGGDSFTYFVRDTDNQTSNAGTVRIRVGAPVSISGSVYVDSNGNGLRDAGEIAVPEAEVKITVVNGTFTHTQSTRTDATGAYSFVDNPAAGIIMPAGKYSIFQTQPALMMDGIEKAGTPAPTSMADNAFHDISLSPGESATGFLFAERQFRSDFVVYNPLLTRLYVASGSISSTDTNPFGQSTPAVLDLSLGNVWLSFDKGLAGRYAFSATAGAGGTIKLEVYNNSSFAAPIASSGAAAGTARVEFTGTAAPMFLKVSGTGAGFSVASEQIVICEQNFLTFPATLFVNSTQWSPAFVSQINTLGLGTNGYEIPSGTIDQFKPAPWTNINQIVVRFGQPVTASASSISVRGVNGGTYAVSNFHYDFGTNVGTWTLATPMVADKVLVDLTGIPQHFDLDGIGADGKLFRFNVLPGDVGQNGKSSIVDLVDVRNRVGQSIGGPQYSVYRDLNGSGAIDNADFQRARLTMFSQLPVGEVPAPAPAPSPAAPDAAVAAVEAVDASATAGNAAGTRLSVDDESADRASDVHAATVRSRPARREAATDAAVRVVGGNEVGTTLRARRTSRVARMPAADALFTVLGGG